MKNITHKASSRGFANHGWLKTHHTFSFANYYDPQRIHFGALRVLNDDLIEGGEGFDLHPHQHMEIITIPLSGEVAHGDSMGHRTVIKPGEVQVMSAGTGLFHSEFNNLPDKDLTLLQIWILPKTKNVTPSYQQDDFSNKLIPNQLTMVVSPNAEKGSLPIHQDAWINLGEFDAGFEFNYSLHGSGNGLYIFVIDGKVQGGDEMLQSRDGIGIWDVSEINIKSFEKSKLILFEVPMIER